jgi:hypothetical protein
VQRPLNRIESEIANLLRSKDFAGLIRGFIRDKEGGLATRYVESRAATFLGGSTKSITHVYDAKRNFGYRRYDINCTDRVFEVKFRGDIVVRWEVEKDLWFRRWHTRNYIPKIDVWYLFIDGPNGEHVRQEDLKRLGNSIPHLHWTWRRFLRLTR